MSDNPFNPRYWMIESLGRELAAKELECAELRKDAERYRFWRDHVDPNNIQEMIMLDPADTDKTVDRYMQTWEEEQERRKSYDHYKMDTLYDR